MSKNLVTSLIGRKVRNSESGKDGVIVTAFIMENYSVPEYQISVDGRLTRDTLGPMSKWRLLAPNGTPEDE